METVGSLLAGSWGVYYAGTYVESLIFVLQKLMTFLKCWTREPIKSDSFRNATLKGNRDMME